MNISYAYLKDFLNTQLSQKKLAEVFTKVGFECEINKSIIEFDITPNRGDVLSLRGLQREFNAFQLKNFKNSLKVTKLNFKKDRSVINQVDKKGCGNYHLLLIRGLSKIKKLDAKKSKFLTAAGIPLINPLVDLGNYVMLEIGAPMHVFDLSKLALPINVTFPKLNDVPVRVIGGDIKNIKNSALTIQDQAGIQAIAGIIGSEESSVSKRTSNIAVEAAFFKPEKIVNQARKYGLATDASHRFERGVDPKIQKLALERYLFLLSEIASFNKAECFFSEHSPNSTKPINLSIERFNSFSGLGLEAKDIKKILQHLGFDLFAETSKYLKFNVPSHRFDMQIEEDLYEELLRCYGYDNIPANKPKSGPKKTSISNNSLSKLRLGLIYAGFKELMNMPFVSHETYASLNSHSLVPAELINPINENESLMRGSLFGGLFSAINLNIKKGYASIKIFELGNVFNKTKDSFSQDTHLSGLIYHHELKKNWGSKEFLYDFFSLKSEIIKLLETLGITDIQFKQSSSINAFSSNALNIYISKKHIGSIGEINLLATQKVLKKPCYGFELYPERIFEDISNTKLCTFSKFPSSSRDLNIIIDKSFVYKDVDDKLSQIKNKIKNLKAFTLINIFEGKGIPDGSISMTLRFIFQSSSKSLLDAEISSEMEQVSLALKKNFKVSFRA